MLGTLAAPSLLGSCTGSESDKAAGISFAMNYFKVSEGDLRKVLAAALEKGGDYADLFFEHSYRNNVGLQDGAVNRASSNIDFGMGVRVLSGDQTGYAYVENVSLDEMLKAARTAARIATGSANTAPINLTEEKHTNNFYSVQTPWDEIAINDKMPFLQKLKAQCDYLQQNVYEKQRENITTSIEWKKKIVREAEDSQKAAKDRMDVARKWLKRYVSLDQQEIATYEYETDQIKNNYLTTVQEVQNINREIASTRMQITEAYHRLEQLEVEQLEKERELKVELLSTHQNLIANMAAWEQKYVFKAPFDGKVEFLKFISDGQFVQAGEAVFGVIPKENHIYGQVLLPANGAGKVKENSKVVIKLENYPYMEYGYIEGYVSSISLVTQTQKTGEKTIETYLINVELPNGLTTNYEETLDFKYELGGTADIIVKDRRLIERLFDNLRYRTK